MGVESHLVLWVLTDECCHPNRFRVDLMLIESFEIGRLDFPNCDTLEPTHCFSPNGSSSATRLAGRVDCNQIAMSGFAAAHGYAAFVISCTLLKNISASLKSGKTQTAPTADNRFARLPVPMPMNGMPTLRQAQASQNPVTNIG